MCRVFVWFRVNVIKVAFTWWLFFDKTGVKEGTRNAYEILLGIHLNLGLSFPRAIQRFAKGLLPNLRC